MSYRDILAYRDAYNTYKLLIFAVDGRTLLRSSQAMDTFRSNDYDTYLETYAALREACIQHNGPNSPVRIAAVPVL